VKTLLIALASLTLAGCSSAADKRDYDYEYLLVHYEADPDSEKDPEHVIKAFKQCLASKPVTEEWETEKATQASQNDPATSVVAGHAKEGIGAEAMRRGSKLQVLVDRCMAAKGYPTVP
jgi:hypothetical protein